MIKGTSMFLARILIDHSHHLPLPEEEKERPMLGIFISNNHFVSSSIFRSWAFTTPSFKYQPAFLCSKSLIETSLTLFWCFYYNFEHISHILVFKVFCNWVRTCQSPRIKGNTWQWMMVIENIREDAKGTLRNIHYHNHPNYYYHNYYH